MLLTRALLHNQRFEFELRRRRMQGILKRFRSNSPSEDGEEDEEGNSRLSEEERQPPAKRRKRWSDADQEGDRSLMKLFSTGRFSDVTVTAGRRRRHHQSPIPSQNNTQSTSQTITTTSDPTANEDEEDDEQDFHLHRNIICLKSDFFDAACRETFKEGITRKIRIPEISPKVFSTIATWMYDGGYELPRRPPPPSPDIKTPDFSESNSDIEDNNEAESKDDKGKEKEDTEMTESEAAEKKISDEITAVYKAADYLGIDGLKLDILRQIKRSVLEDRSVPSTECRLKDPLSLFYNICESYQLRDWSKLREVADALAPLWYFQDDELLREAKRAANPAIVILLDAFQELVMSLFCDDCVESGLSQNISGRCCKCDVEVDFKRREGGPVEGRKN